MSKQTSWQPIIEWVDPQMAEIPAALREIAAAEPFLAQMLAQRGIREMEPAAAFLDPQFYSPSNAYDLPNLDIAVERINTAIRRNQTIGVWGDFDVDGQTSTTILVDTLRKLGAKVAYHIPVRARESHGVGLSALKTFLEGGVDLVLTCDTGIAAHDAVAYANGQGIDFIITDHHTLPATLPPAHAVINPQRLNETHPMRTLSGSGTAYQLASALAEYLNHGEIAEQQLDLAALGLVADLALLTGDARYLVQRGLAALRQSRRLGIQTLLQTAGVDPTYLNEEHIGFMLAPRLNAIGRLDDANPIVSFFTTTDPAEAHITAERLEGLNAQRKLLSDQVFRGALAQIEREQRLLDSPVLVLSHPQWHAGVVGIVASRLVELFNRPAILLTAPPGEPARGSARSVEGINITAAIRECAHLLLGFGGHPMAAGLSLQPDRIPEFQRAISLSITRQVQGLHLARSLQIDAYISFSQIDFSLAGQIDRLAPFGPGNPAPLLASSNLTILSERLIGKEQEHRKLILADESNTQQEVIWWNSSELPLPTGRFDLAYQLRASNYRGAAQLELVWLHARDREPDLINLSATRYEWVDFRSVAFPQRTLAELSSAHPDLLVWQEGEQPSPPEGSPRSALRPTENLAIWNPPPGHAELEQAIALVNPRKIYLFGVNLTAQDSPIQFVRRLMGLIVYAINNQSGRTTVSRLAEATAQREATIRAGLHWLAARGQLVILQDDENGLWLDPGGQPDEQYAQKAEKELKYLLQETAAYRAFYLRTAPENLLEAN